MYYPCSKIEPGSRALLKGAREPGLIFYRLSAVRGTACKNAAPNPLFAAQPTKVFRRGLFSKRPGSFSPRPFFKKAGKFFAEAFFQKGREVFR
ncbi:hypothetical protein FMM72_12355 [Anaerotruncus colihominis]|uniref:Uncharacterized protein n=1 Tax=Anaerotruncus colihominis TaxID=169435 RepID=A0A845SU21_9FIRM|nr:hypothetical protein [Anaerotruncus colihominis]